MNKEYKMPELKNIKVAFDKFAEETKEFLQKPRYVYCEDKKYIVDTELDVLVDIDGVIDRLNTQCFQKKELLRNIRIKDEQIADLQHRLEVAERSLEIQELKDKIEQLKQSQKQLAIEELEGLQVQCQFSITFADYKQEQRLYDYIDDRIKELKGVDVNA